MRKKGPVRFGLVCLLVAACSGPATADWIEFSGGSEGAWTFLETEPSSLDAASDFVLRIDPSALVDPRLDADGSGTFRIAAGGFEFCYSSPEFGQGCYDDWDGVETDPNDIIHHRYAHLTFVDTGSSRWELRFDAIVPGCDFVEIPPAEEVPGDPCARVALSVLFFSRPGESLLPVVSGWEQCLDDFCVEAVDLHMDRDAVWIAPYRESDAVTPLWSYEGAMTVLDADNVAARPSSFGGIKALFDPRSR